MLKYLKKFFQTKEVELRKETVPMKELDTWLGKEVCGLNLSQFEEYCTNMDNVRANLNKATEKLKTMEISKEHKNVEQRVKNIVTGHKDNYLNQLELFNEKHLTVPEAGNSLDHFQRIIKFNRTLDKEIEALAKRTGKSYQAAQHLFFDGVEEVFKTMGQLNKMVKDFSKKDQVQQVKHLEKLQAIVSEIRAHEKGQHLLAEEVRGKEADLRACQEKLQQTEKELTDLRKTKNFIQLQETKGIQKELMLQKGSLDNQIFSFFSKLHKPMKKYEKIALDNKQVQAYLLDSLRAFGDDTELSILVLLGSMEKSIKAGSLQFDEKQKEKYLQLIDQSDEVLKSLAARNKNLSQEIEEVQQKLDAFTIEREIEEKQDLASLLATKRSNLETDSEALQSKLSGFSEKSLHDFQELAKKSLRVDLHINT